MKNKGGKIGKALVQQAFSETVGEGATELSNIVMNAWVMAENSDIEKRVQEYMAAHPDWTEKQAWAKALKDTTVQILKAAGGGALSGSFMGTSAAAVNTGITNYQKNRQAYNLYGESQQELVSEALELDPDNAYAQKLQLKLDSDKQLSGAQLRKLAAQNEAVIQSAETQNQTSQNVTQPNATTPAAKDQINATVNQEDVAKMLLGKGFYTQKVSGVAEAITARLNGQELTRTQKSILSSALNSSTVRDTISEFLKKKTNGIDKPQNNVYDDSDIRDGFAGEEKTASWNDSLLEAPSAVQEGNLLSDVDAFAAEEPSNNQEQNMSSAEIDNRDFQADILSNGQSIDSMAELYAEKVKSNRKWRWKDAFPNAGKLSKGDKSSIKKRAIEKGLIPNVPVKVVKASNKKTYRYVEFEAAGLVKEKIRLPEYLWAETDKVQFKWLDEQIGGRPRGYTWHHSEVDGQMELVPTGIHRIYHHNGGRTKNHWAYREGGR